MQQLYVHLAGYSPKKGSTRWLTRSEPTPGDTALPETLDLGSVRIVTRTKIRIRGAARALCPSGASAARSFPEPDFGPVAVFVGSHFPSGRPSALSIVPDRGPILSRSSLPC